MTYLTCSYILVSRTDLLANSLGVQSEEFTDTFDKFEIWKRAILSDYFMWYNTEISNMFEETCPRFYYLRDMRICLLMWLWEFERDSVGLYGHSLYPKKMTESFLWCRMEQLKWSFLGFMMVCSTLSVMWNASGGACAANAPAPSPNSPPPPPTPSDYYEPFEGR